MELDLSWITPSLAIGGCFPVEHTELLRDHRIGAVVDLRAEACDDAALLDHHGIAFLHLPTPDMCGVSCAMLSLGVEFVAGHLAADRKVLVHCQYGIGRSALLGLCVLVHDGHSPADALALAKDRRARVSPSQQQYEAWVGWLTGFRNRPDVSWDIPTFAEFAAVAYRHLQA
ncbi:MAG: Dual specificity protein phosphatase [Myxococcales bacterium]|nr:Dual specificity protein phosphatase [Myxococcales bacterium]